MDGSADEDFEKLSIEDRLVHKSWKARLSAYTSLTSTYKSSTSEDDACFRQNTAIDSWLKDANAVAQEKAVETACALIEFGGKQAANATRDAAIPAIVDKCLGSARAGTKNKAVELCLLYVEADETHAESIIDALSAGLDAKQPKVVAGTVTAIKEIIRQFGPKVVPPKPILRLLPKIFAHADKTVRSEGVQLALSLHAYLGPALTPHLSELKPVQQKELAETFEKADADGKGVGSEEGKQKRFTRTQQRQRALQEAESTLSGGAAADDAQDGEAAAQADEDAADVDPAMDPYELAEPVDILNKLPDDFWTHLNSAKWKDRKELAFEPLLASLQGPRLASGSYSELLSALAARVSSDANVICVALAANAIERIAIGLRKDVAQYKDAVVPPLLTRTKEKKQNVLDAIGAALDATVAYAPLGETTELATPFLSDKNPSVRLQTLLFLARTLSSTPTIPSPTSVQPLGDQLVAALGDSVEANRTAAAEALGTLAKVVGERAMAAKIDSLDDVRKAKVKEAMDKATIKAKPAKGGPSASQPKVAAAPAPKVSKPMPRIVAAALKKEDGVPTAVKPPASPKPSAPSSSGGAPAPRGPPARLMAKKPTTAPSTASAAAAVKKPAPSAAAAKSATQAKPAEAIKYKYSQEAAENQVEEGALPSAMLAQISEANWKARLEGMTSLHDWLTTGEGRSVDPELVVRYLNKKPGPKESNFQVAAKVFAIFQSLAESRDDFDRAAAALSIPWLSDKLGDIKLKKPAGDALTTYAEKSSIQFVLSHAYDPMSKQKAPKAQADSMLWIESTLRDFGIAGLSIRDLMEFLKTGLKSANAPVRTNATKALVTLKLFVGADLSNFLQDLNPQLLSTIEGEFAKVASESPPAPTKTSADNAAPGGGNAAGGSVGAGAAAGQAEDPMDDLFPRVDLDRLISSSSIASINDSNWKVRKEALEGIQSILEQHKRFKQGPLSELVTALKQRMTDANKIVQALALDVIARLATGTGKPFAPLARSFAAPVAGVLADAKVNIRTAGTTTLTAMADASGLDSMIAAFEKPLENTNPLLRKELLSWLQTRFEDKAVAAALDVSNIVGPVIGCLEDRSTDVRKPATAILPDLIARAGYNSVMDHVAKLKPASKSTVLPLIEAAKSTAPALPAAAAASSAPPPATAAAKVAPTTQASARAPATASSGLRKPAVSRIGAGNVGVAKSIRSVPSSSSLEAKVPVARPRQSIGGLRAKATASNPVAAPMPAPAKSAREPPFLSADPKPKQVRASRDAGPLKWQVDGPPRSDQVDALQAQMTPHTSPDMLAQLFSQDHNAEREYTAALTTLIECVSDPAAMAATYDIAPHELKARLIANVDVIFKYITLRLTLTSTTINLKCLELVDHLIKMLDEEGHKLSEYEAGALLLSLIVKVGDGKDAIRQRVRHLFRAICTVYPFSKVFASMLEYGLTSKNPRARSECADEMGHFIQRHGLTPFPTGKVLPALGKLIGDRDASVRAAALSAIGHAYSFIGNDVYNLIGPLPSKERTLLDERLKRTATAANNDASRPSTPELTSASSAHRDSQSPRDVKDASPKNVSPVAGISRIAKPAAGIPVSRPTGFKPVPPSASSANAGSAIPAPRSRLSLLPQLQTRDNAVRSVSGQTAASDSPSDAGPSSGQFRKLIRDVGVKDMNESSEALKKIQREIIEQPELMLAQADLLIETVTKQMNVAFSDLSPSSSHEQLRLCKHLMNVLTHFFDHKTLGQAISPPVLTSLIADLTGRLLDTAEQTSSDAISSLSKVLNMVLIRIFHNADQGMCFTALFTVLGDSTIDLRELRGEELASRAKYAELVMKCLWKVSKTVKESLEGNQLPVSRLLRDINQFLSVVPPAEWRRRLNDNLPLGDMPLRTVKTILQQIVAVHGEHVFNELDEIPHAEESFVYQYLQRIVNSSQGSEGSQRRPSQDSQSTGKHSSMSSLRPAATASTTTNCAPSPALRPIPSAPGSPAIPPASSAAAMSPRTNGSDIDMNHRLKVIFDRIGDPSESRAGIEDLYRFQKEHPEASARVSQWMANTGKYFQTYLQRALDNLASADREKQRPASSRADESPLIPAAAQSPIPDSDSTSAGAASKLPATTPRRSRLSVSQSGTAPSAAKLQELQNVFGFSQGE